MNGGAASDLLLALVCAAIVWRQRRERPGVALAAGLIGLAAMIGTLRLSGMESLVGPHRFFSMLAATAGFPLLGFALRYPDDPVAARATGAWRFAVLAGGLGVGLTVSGLTAWGPALSLLAVLVILVTMAAARQLWRLLGALLMLAGMLMTLAGERAPIETTVALHLGLALGLVLLCLPLPKFKPRSIASLSPRG